jgi:NAD(P)-dependent dehydrogenase (short-subunit alcohol dehydrogenase family)
VNLGLRGKRALVTGASRGIGRAVAEVLAEEGCELELAARTAGDLAAAREELEARHRVRIRTHAVDLGEPGDQQRLVEAAGPVDILVNNAGAMPHGDLESVPEEAWRRAWDLKVLGFVHLMRSYLPRMRAAGGGVIVNVIGNAGERVNPGYVLGTGGNAALMALTRAVGSATPDANVRVVGVNPGLTATDRARARLEAQSRARFGRPDRIDQLLAEMNLPFGRWATPREVAEVVVFLASPRASYVSGTIVSVDGGATYRRP